MLFDSQEQKERQPSCMDGAEKITARGRIPGGGSGPFFFTHCPFLQEYSPGKEITMQNEKILAYLEGQLLSEGNEFATGK